MGAGRLPAGLSALLWLLCAPAAANQLLLHTTPVAGLPHHDAAAVWSHMRIGDALELRADPANPHDARAVEVRWNTRRIGYLPAASNAPLAEALARGLPLRARILSLRDHPNPRERMRIEVLLDLSPGFDPAQQGAAAGPSN